MTLKVYIFDAQDIPLNVLMNSNFLSELEKISFEKYKNLEIKKEKVVGAIFKNKYIGEYFSNEYGKPCCKDGYFNLSHSHGFIAFTKDDVPVGIDVERIRKADNDLIDYISNDEEKKYIRNNINFFEIWTNKESLVKALGTGIKKVPKDIPGLPINGRHIYEGVTFFNKTIKYDDCIITVSRAKDEDFDIEIIKEVI